MPTKRFSRSLVAVAVVVAISAGFVAGRHDAAPQWIDNAHAAGAVPSLQPAVPAPASAPMMPAEAARTTGMPDFSGLVDAYGPAVVNISAEHLAKSKPTANGQRRVTPFGNMSPDDPFFQFFKRFYGDQFPGGGAGGDDDGGGASDQNSMSLGSGFIISPDGYILTNAHVVAGANVITVKLTDKREFRAKVVGSDKQSDVAVLKIDAKSLPTVKIGDASKSKVGQWVVAIGSPYGFDNTVTSGIISAKARSLPDENYIPFIQTDVPVNPGNSGGPLFDMNGNVIGINSMIFSRTGGFQGLSFAIPINFAMKIKDDLIKSGHVERGRLGVAVQSVNQSLAQSFGLPKPEGALVSSIDKDGPAAKSQLKPGDVILAVDGVTIDDSATLPTIIADMKPGSTAHLTVWRDKKEKDITVSIGTFPNATKVASDDSNASQVKLGVAVRALTPDERRQASVAGGLLVEQVAGPAAAAGIQPGDVILAINGQPLTAADQLKDRLANAGTSVALLIQRNNQQIFVPVDLE
ncbi:DegQ family serine endoprotease [Pararobbsia silviterrae]|uniref:Probable periplasmic serine endoprotease DegP-like n=1 Tax=Pararobbsia silviterrae TaxID=1792498 RepID=A0A494Y8K7_9BURK|nr:DegQ family serine endoprotease [Pararobbsia silviterrae]RKP59009.1 DegQ family serine endoprotease [Pararobbsia silviterrae]